MGLPVGDTQKAVLKPSNEHRPSIRKSYKLRCLGFIGPSKRQDNVNPDLVKAEPENVLRVRQQPL